jgi:hypothetical protein
LFLFRTLKSQIWLNSLSLSLNSTLGYAEAVISTTGRKPVSVGIVVVEVTVVVRDSLLVDITVLLTTKVSIAVLKIVEVDKNVSVIVDSIIAKVVVSVKEMV